MINAMLRMFFLLILLILSKTSYSSELEGELFGGAGDASVAGYESV